MDYEKDLPQAAALPPGEPGYLHVVENSASKRPLKWRTGAVLDAGLVHLDWLNEWGESRKPPHVFSTVSAPEPQAAAPAPVVADSASDAPDTSKGTPPKLTEVDKAEIQRLYNRGRGASVNAMAKQFNVSRPTIEKVLQRAGIKK